jgi:hypothetical protein
MLSIVCTTPASLFKRATPFLEVAIPSLVCPKSDRIGRSSKAVKIVKRLVAFGVVAELKDIIRRAFEYIKEEMEELSD